MKYHLRISRSVCAIALCVAMVLPAPAMAIEEERDYDLSHKHPIYQSSNTRQNKPKGGEHNQRPQTQPGVATLAAGAIAGLGVQSVYERFGFPMPRITPPQVSDLECFSMSKGRTSMLIAPVAGAGFAAFMSQASNITSYFTVPNMLTSAITLAGLGNAHIAEVNLVRQYQAQHSARNNFFSIARPTAENLLTNTPQARAILYLLSSADIVTTDAKSKNPHSFPELFAQNSENLLSIFQSVDLDQISLANEVRGTQAYEDLDKLLTVLHTSSSDGVTAIENYLQQIQNTIGENILGFLRAGVGVNYHSHGKDLYPNFDIFFYRKEPSFPQDKHPITQQLYNTYYKAYQWADITTIVNIYLPIAAFTLSTAAWYTVTNALGIPTT